MPPCPQGNPHYQLYSFIMQVSTDHVSELDVEVGGKLLNQRVVVSGEQTTTANGLCQLVNNSTCNRCTVICSSATAWREVCVERGSNRTLCTPIDQTL